MNILLILWFTDSGGYDIFSESVCHITLCQYVQTYDKYQASAVTQSCDMSEAWVISILPLILCHVMWGMRTQFEHFLSSSVMWHEGCAHNLNISSHPPSCDMRDVHTISAIPVSLSFSSITFLYHVFFTSYPPLRPLLCLPMPWLLYTMHHISYWPPWHCSTSETSTINVYAGPILQRAPSNLWLRNTLRFGSLVCGLDLCFGPNGQSYCLGFERTWWHHRRPAVPATDTYPYCNSSIKQLSWNYWSSLSLF